MVQLGAESDLLANSIVGWLAMIGGLGMIFYGVRYILLHRQESSERIRQGEAYVESGSSISFDELDQAKNHSVIARPIIVIAGLPIVAVVTVALLDVGETQVAWLVDFTIFAAALFTMGGIFVVAIRSNLGTKNKLAHFARVNGFELVKNPNKSALVSYLPDGAYDGWSVTGGYFMLRGEYRGVEVVIISCEMTKGTLFSGKQMSMRGLVIIDSPLLTDPSVGVHVDTEVLPHPARPSQTMMVIPDGVPLNREAMANIFWQIDQVVDASRGAYPR